MAEQNTTSTMTVESRPRSSKLPLLLALLVLLFLLPLSFLFSRWLLDQCLAAVQANTSSAEVMGVTNLDVRADSNQAEAGDVVTFNVTGDNSGPLSNGVVTFNLVGDGKIQSAPVGTGICLKISDTRATCTGLNLLSNEAVSYTVPVVVDAVCGLTGGEGLSLNVNLDDNTTQDVNATGVVSCATAGTGTTSSAGNGGQTTSTPSGTGTTTSATSSSDSGDVTSDSAEVTACYTQSNNALLLGAFLSFLLALLVFVVATMGTRDRRYYN